MVRKMLPFAATRLLPGLIALALLASTASAETAEEALKRLDQKAKQIATAHFKQQMTTSSQMLDSKTDAEVWAKREADGTYKMRTVSTSDMTFKGIDMPPQKTSVLSVNDGQFMWSETDSQGMKSVSKIKALPESQTGLASMVDQVNQGKGRVLEPEAIDGKQCVVIEYELDEMGAGMPVTHRMWIAEDTGMMLKSTTKGGYAGDSEMILKDIKIGVPIEDSTFTYTPPAGVEVMDMTSMM